LSIDSIFGDLINTKRFTDDYIEALTSLYENGARETLRRWIVDTP